MNARVLRSLPTGEEGGGGVSLRYEELEGVVDFEYLKGGVSTHGEVAFDGVAAFRFRGEMHSAGFVTASYDSTW